ncbi:MAG: hypothetical protein IKV91_00315 [Bacteroidales bacterium]|nr:hypothetical protein [Bacteroidales bacterium]
MVIPDFGNTPITIIAMIVSESTLLVVTLVLSLLITIGIGIVFVRKHVFDNNKAVWSVCFLIFFGLFFVSDWVLRLPLKTIEVIESSSDKSYTHETNLIYGNNVVRTRDGQEISIKGLGMRAGKVYAINFSHRDMLFYPTSYSSTEGIFLFNKDKEPQLPEALLLGIDEYIELDEEPDFWFMNAPEEIQIERGFWGQLWDSIFNVNYIRWAVIPYDPDTTE